MALVSDASLVLQAFPYSETSKVLRLLMREHGVRSVIAKGALRPRSRYGGILEPFTEGIATTYLKDGRELQTLSGFDLIRSRQRLGTDLVRFGAASLLAELVLRTASETSDPGLYDQVRDALDRVETADLRIDSVALAEAWSLVARLGFAPSLTECIACGRGLGAGEEASFDFSAGGVRCDECAAGFPGRPIPPEMRSLLSKLVVGEAVPIERPAAHWRLLGRFLDHHVLEGGSLRSLEFLAEVGDGR